MGPIRISRWLTVKNPLAPRLAWLIPKRPPVACRAFALSLLTLGFAACSRETASSASVPAAPAAASAKPNRFKFETQTLTVPAGFTVELVAGPPAVNRPISIAFDEQGRLYATDSSGLSERADKQQELKPHRIVRLEDADGDGRFERSTVFAEHMMFPQGAQFFEGSLYVAAPPQIWKLTDANGDGVAEQREIWFDGKTLTGCANDIHGPYLGPDGWMYWTKGAFAEQKHTLANGKELVTRASHIFRSRPDGTGLESVLTGGMDNPVGVAFSSTGERFLSGTFFQVGVAGKRDGVIHSVYGGVYGKDQPAVAGHIRTGDLMPIMTHMGAAAPCGTTTYRSQRFGAGYQDNLFVCYFNLHKVVRHELVPDGATFTTKDTDFVTSDSQDFHPTDVLEDADGSLLVVDTGGWYKICCPTSQLAKPDVLGGIYRIRKIGAPKLDDPRGLAIAWATRQPEDLVKLLADARPDVQQRAVHLLGKQGAAVVPALATGVTKAASVAARRNAVWALARVDGPAARAAVRSALADADASVVYAAMQVVSLWRDAGAFERLQSLVAGEKPAQVRMAAEALGRIGDRRAVGALLTAARTLNSKTFTASGTPEDQAGQVLEHSLTYALIEIGARDEVRALLQSSTDPRVIRVALVALDQMEGGGLQPGDVIGRLDSNVPVLKRTAGWVVGHHAEWGGALASFFQTRLTTKFPAAAERGELQLQLAQLATAAAIQDLLAATALDASAALDARLLALRAMAAAGLKEAPARWLSDLAAVLGGPVGDPALGRQAVATVRVLPLPRPGHAELAAALGRLGRDGAAPVDVRVDALAAIPGGPGAIEPALFDFVRAHLDGREPMLVRSAAASVLARAALTPDQQLALAETMKTVGPLEAPKLLPAFEKSPGEALGLKLVAALKNSPGLPGLRVGALKALFAKYPATVQGPGQELIALIDADAARQNAHVDELLANAKHGDIRRGQAVFNSEKTACSMCHVIGYLGGRLGPDLTSIGRIRNERELLEAVVYPSATLVRGYEPFVVTTKGGEALSGIVRQETAQEVVLATGPQTEQRVARADIADLRPGAVSPMPPGLETVLTKQELADLLAFLKSRGI